MRYANVTLDTGEVLGPVGLHQDGYGLRFYVSERGRIRLLAAIPGGSIGEWGVKNVLRDETGKRVAVTRSAVIRGDLPSSFAHVEYRGGCQCGHPLKAFRPPFDWEPVT